MWPRVCEFMIACWLGASPFIFRHANDAWVMWISDFTCAAVVGTLGLISYWKPTRHAHLLIIPIALWLIGFGRFGDSAPLPPGLQNNIVVGITLLMFAIIPNYTTQPPNMWFEETGREYH